LTHIEVNNIFHRSVSLVFIFLSDEANKMPTVSYPPEFHKLDLEQPVAK